MLRLLILLLLAFPGSSRLPKAKKQVLFVFAHPDDETAIAPVLARLAREHTVTGIIATDGKGGTRVAGTEGDSLGRVRRSEGNCSFAALGLQPPIYLGPDGDTGHPEHRVISSMVTEVLLR